MALLHTYFFSETLGMSVAVDVILPQYAQKQVGMAAAVRQGKAPVLWLLHGGSDNHTIWQRRTSIERYVADLGMAVIMPNAHLSSYTDMAHGGKYFTYIADELPAVMRGFFPMLSDRREDNFISGLSMGGYGCMKIGLSRPQNYAAIGCFSAGNHAKPRTDHLAARMAAMRERVFGVAPDASLEGTKHDLLWLGKQLLDAGGPYPRVYMACGTEDGGIDNFRATADFFEKAPGDPFGFKRNERPGVHEWGFWDTEIQNFLKFIDLPKVEGIRN